MSWLRWTPLGVVLLNLVACSTPRNSTWPEPRPLGDDFVSYHPPISAATLDAASDAHLVSRADLTLPEALSLALLQNPNLRAFAWEVRAHEALTLQAGLRPNPEIGTDLEDFAGTGPLSRFEATEITFGLSQLIELGGDRRRRQQVASLERDLAGWDYETVRLDVLTETAQAFTRVLAAQQRQLLADSLLTQAHRFYQSVAARVVAGKVSALEERRALVVRSTTQIAFERAIRELSIARSQLAATWGRSDPDFEQVEGQLAYVEAVPGYDRLKTFLERNPDVARWQTEMAMRRADLALEHARRIPDPVLSIGTRRIRELGETALAAGISIPIPFFNRNQGAIHAARYRLRQGEEAHRATSVRAEQMLAQTYEQLAMTYAEVTTLRDDILPAARENFTATEEGYREGKFDLLSVLDAQRTLFEMTNQYVDALAAYHITRSEVERLIGTPLSDLLTP